MCVCTIVDAIPDVKVIPIHPGFTLYVLITITLATYTNKVECAPLLSKMRPGKRSNV